ncbi:MAG: pyrroline-5-carboxylate reductase [Desulfobulbaceae bacterium]|jgi:pyrroline-5-carboxylate reductase|nr:pyrroline-5-carboxylate reductase [Desulfobulbaceae bacterium]
MKLSQKIGFLGGGQMAEALIKGMIQGDLVEPSQLFVIDPVAARCDLLNGLYHINASTDNKPIWQCDIIIIAVKPQVMGGLLDSSKDFITSHHLCISIAAGVPLSFMEGILEEGCRVVRVMPNTPALVLEGASALSPGANVSKEDMVMAKTIFDAVGSSVVLPEQYLDGVTGLSGSGPAYVFTFIEAMIEAGLKVGLPRAEAVALTNQTILGSVKLAMETGKHPAELKAMVTSPGGTTIAGLHELEKAGFKAGVMNCVEAAANRSIELGKLF